MDEEVCNPMIVCVSHKSIELENITVGRGGQKMPTDLNGQQIESVNMNVLPQSTTALS